MTLLFPTTIILMNAAASAFYAFDGDMRRCIYWAACAVITAAVTF